MKKYVVLFLALFILSLGVVSAYGYNMYSEEDYHKKTKYYLDKDKKDYKEKYSETKYFPYDDIVVTRSLTVDYENSDRYSTYDYRHGYSYRNEKKYWRDHHDLNDWEDRYYDRHYVGEDVRRSLDYMFGNKKYYGDRYDKGKYFPEKYWDKDDYYDRDYDNWGKYEKRGYNDYYKDKYYKDYDYDSWDKWDKKKYNEYQKDIYLKWDPYRQKWNKKNCYDKPPKGVLLYTPCP